MRYKSLMESMSNEMRFDLTSKLNKAGNTMLEEAEVIVGVMGPWESTVFPKYVTFLAKKRRLKSLRALCEEYVSHLYDRESMSPSPCSRGDAHGRAGREDQGEDDGEA